MNEPCPSNKLQALSETRLLRLLMLRLERREARHGHADPDRQGLREMHELMSELARRPGRARLFAGLARQLEKEPDLRQLTAISVAIERALDRRVRDEDFLPVTDRSSLHVPRMPVHVVADSLRSSFNIGGIFRTAECFGIAELVLTGYSATPDHHRVAKAAMGTDGYLPWRYVRQISDLITQLRDRGLRIIALEKGDQYQRLELVTPEFPCAVLLGNERFGQLSKILDEADQVISIASYGRKNSLNVVSALSICLHAFRQSWEARAAKRN